MRCTFAVAVLLSLAAPASAQKITIAVVPSVPGGATYVALDKGYFRDAGLDVDIERIDSLGKAVAFLATNQVQVAQGGINAGFYNSVAQGLPVALASKPSRRASFSRSSGASGNSSSERL